MTSACRNLMPLSVILASLLGACAESGPSTGTDEHTNSLSMRILVLDTAGRPAANSKVTVREIDWLEDPTESNTGIHTGRIDATTDSAGICQFQLPSDSSFVVRAGGPDHASAVMAGRDAPHGATLVLQRTGSVQGVIAGVDAGVPVRAAGLPGIAWTDDNGRFSLGSLPATTVRLQIGFGENRMRIDNLVIRPGRSLDLGALPPLGAAPSTLVSPSGKESIRPNPPAFTPSGGSFAVPQEIALTTDGTGTIETSNDGIHWYRIAGTFRVMASACVRARVVSDQGILSNPSEACFSIAP